MIPTYVLQGKSVVPRIEEVVFGTFETGKLLNFDVVVVKR
jgi:hypothetical protein